MLYAECAHWSSYMDNLIILLYNVTIFTQLLHAREKKKKKKLVIKLENEIKITYSLLS